MVWREVREESCAQRRKEREGKDSGPVSVFLCALCVFARNSLPLGFTIFGGSRLEEVLASLARWRNRDCKSRRKRYATHTRAAGYPSPQGGAGLSTGRNLWPH